MPKIPLPKKLMAYTLLRHFLEIVHAQDYADES